VSTCVLSLLRRRQTDGISFLPATHNSAREKAVSSPKVRASDRRASEFSLRVSGGGGAFRGGERGGGRGKKSDSVGKADTVRRDC